MNSKSLALAIGLIAAGSASAEIRLTVENASNQALTVEQRPLDENKQAPEPLSLTLDADGKAVFTQAAFPVEITISNGGDAVASRVYSANAAEVIAIEADGVGGFTAAGTPLMEGVTRVNQLLEPYINQYTLLTELYTNNPEGVSAQIDALIAEMTAAVSAYMAGHPDGPDAVYALMMLDGQDFLDAYKQLSPAAKTSILMPMVEKKKTGEENAVAQELRIRQMESGDVDAPAFTLPDLDGKQVSLSDFKGKWVVIDFWGSWCRWCVKGFPELKELSEKYGDELVIIGVDCRDTQEDWRYAVELYDLTWVNLYNDCSGETNPLLTEYAVQGFPTKVIVAPDGKIRKVVIGADPAFPSILAGLMGK